MGEDFNITGTWVNKLTGDKIIVRNTFIDGDNMIIQTSDGRQISMNEFQNYIQMSEDEYDSNGHKIGHGLSDFNDIMNIENERRVIVGNSNTTRRVIDNSVDDNIKETLASTVKYIEKQEATHDNIKTVDNRTDAVKESEKLLKKLFEKVELDVDVKVDLDCTNFPSKELNMLQTIYDVSVDEISDYILKNVINEEVIRSAVAAYVKAQLK